MTYLIIHLLFGILAIYLVKTYISIVDKIDNSFKDSASFDVEWAYFFFIIILCLIFSYLLCIFMIYIFIKTIKEHQIKPPDWFNKD